MPDFYDVTLTKQPEPVYYGTAITLPHVRSNAYASLPTVQRELIRTIHTLQFKLRCASANYTADALASMRTGILNAYTLLEFTQAQAYFNGEKTNA